MPQWVEPAVLDGERKLGVHLLQFDVIRNHKELLLRTAMFLSRSFRNEDGYKPLNGYN